MSDRPALSHSHRGTQGTRRQPKELKQDCFSQQRGDKGADTSTWHQQPSIRQGISEKNRGAAQSRRSPPISPGPRDRSLSREDKPTTSESFLFPNRTLTPCLCSTLHPGRKRRQGCLRSHTQVAPALTSQWQQQPGKMQSCQMSHLSYRGFFKDGSSLASTVSSLGHLNAIGSSSISTIHQQDMILFSLTMRTTREHSDRWSKFFNPVQQSL